MSGSAGRGTALAAYWLAEGVRAKRAETQESGSERLAHVLMMGTVFFLVAFYDAQLGKLNWRFVPSGGG